MRKTGAALAWLLAAPLGAAEPPPEPVTLERVLETVSLAPADVGLRAEAFTQPYLASVVKDALMKPFDAAPRLQRWCEAVLKKQSDPAAVIAAMTEQADFGVTVPPKPPAAAPAAAFDASGDLPAWLQSAVADFLAELDRARAPLAEAFAAAAPEDRAAALALADSILLEAAAPAEPPVGPLAETSVETQLRRVDALGRMPRQAAALSAARLAAALQALKRRLLAKEKDFLNVPTMRFKRPEGWVIVGGPSNDVHEPGPDDVLVLDVGGDDVYRGRAAAGRDGGAAAALDLSGNDFYVTAENHALAAGVWGAGVLLDARGDDVYQSAGGSQGCGVFGAGVLIDEQGDDLYNARRGSQGAAFWGTGLLSDQAGDDAYRLDRLGQGFAGVGGAGLLLDGGGNDQYLAGYAQADPREPGVFQSMAQGFAIGLRDFAAGGVGVLADGGGHDFYRADYFGQGSAYWLGLGALYDRRGRDTYVSRRYAQGAGVHSAAGFLLDASDDDVYYAWGGSQALGWDYAVGVLLDQRGNDIYSADWGSQGYGGATGWGLFTDNGGSDLYYARKDFGQGYSPWDERRSVGGLGFFADLGGADRYPDDGREGGTWNVERWGAGVDAATGSVAGLKLSEDLPPAPEDPAHRQEAEERRDLQARLARADATADARLRVAELLDVAGFWGLDTATPQAARRRLMNLSTASAFPALTEALDCRSTLGYVVQEEIYLRYGPRSAEALVERLRALDAAGLAEDARSRAGRFGLFYLGQTASTQAVPYLLEKLESASWKERASAAQAIGKIFERRLREHAASLEAALAVPFGRAAREGLAKAFAAVPYKDRLRLLFDRQPVPYAAFEKLMEPSMDAADAKMDKAWAEYFDKNRKLLAEDLARRKGTTVPPETLAALARGLDDPDEGVRHAAAAALGRVGEAAAAAPLAARLSDDKALVRDAAAWALGSIGAAAEPALAEALLSTAPAARAAALEALARFDSPRLTGELEKALKDPAFGVRWRALEVLWRKRGPLFLDAGAGRTKDDLRVALEAALAVETDDRLRGALTDRLRRLRAEGGE